MMKIKRSSLLALVASLAAGVGLLAAGGVLANKDPVEAKAAAGDVYQLVTDVSQLTEGDTVIFTSKNDQYVLSTVPSGGYATAAAISATGDKIIIENNTVVQEMLVGTVGNAFTFQFENGTFASLNNSANNLHTSTKSDSKNAQWTVKVNEDEAVVTNAQYTDRMLQFNSSANPKRFLCYKSSSRQQNIHIWEKTVVETISEITIDVTNFQNQYEEGQTSWITDGIVVKDANGNELDHADVTFVFSDATGNVYVEPNALATKVTATYTGLGASDPAPSVSADITVKIVERDVVSIRLDTTNVKTEYLIGEKADYSGLEVYLVYNIGAETPLNDLTKLTFDPEEGTVLDDTSITEASVTYEGLEPVTFAIQVSTSISGTYRFITEKGTVSEVQGVKNITPTVGKDDSNKNTGVWSGDYVTMVQEQQKSSTSVSLDYEEIRVYVGHLLTITPMPNTKINGVSWTHSKSDPNNWKNGNVDGDSLTLIIPENPVSICPDEQIRFNYIEVEWTSSIGDESFGEVASISVAQNPNKTTYRVGEAFASDGLIIKATDVNGNEQNIESGFTTDLDGYVFAEEDVGTKTVTVTYEGQTAQFTVQVNPIPTYEYVFESEMFSSNKNVMLGNTRWNLVAPGVTNFSYEATGSQRGQAIGKGSGQVTLRSELFGEENKIGIDRVVVNAAEASDAKAKLSVKVGNVQIGEEVDLSGVPVEYSFEVPASSLLAGHIEIDINRNPSTGDSTTVYIKSIAVYASAVSEGAEVMEAARAIEAANVCDADTADEDAAYETYATYIELMESQESKDLLDSIMIDDYADGDVAHANAKVYNRCTVKEKADAIAMKQNDKAIAGLFLGDKDGDTTAAIVAVGSLAVLMGLGGIFLLRKKRMLGR